jgi:tRNA A-37 threonylcarbamoyl transferase component Bud32
MLVGKDIGPFHVLSELGSGAMGFVYRAVRRDSGKHFAIKMIAFGLLGSEKAVERFEREADILKQLKHPNIVRYAGTGSYKRTPFFIMEYVEGESLDKILARREKFSWEDVVGLGKQLCAALEHAHGKGIIHRDLKPSNLMILKGGTLKLTDFGIAKGADLTALTGTNCTVGTAAYMSPEQCRGEKTVSAKSDLYSMGVVFYELLTGRKPFQAESPIEMFQAHVSAPFDRPSHYVMDIPFWLDNLVCQLLEKKPEHRPFDAVMVAKVLEEVEQKVADLRSAGLDVATARTTDRGRNRPADETDRDAARTLRTAVGKRKFRKKMVPWTQRKWVQAVMLSAALVGLGGVVFAMTRPPAAEKLYRAAQSAAEAKDYQSTLDAAERYLRFYGSRDDDSAQQVRAWERSARTDRRESQLHNRIYGKLRSKPDGDLEKLAYQAVEKEDEGDVQAASADWKKLEIKVQDSGGGDTAVYGWVAQKKLASLTALLQWERKLTEVLDYEHALKQVGPKPDLGPAEQSCVEALRFEQFGDLPAARDHWEAIRDKYHKMLDERGWAILAAVHVRELKPIAVNGPEKEREFREKLLANRLAEADAVPHSADPKDRGRALTICRDVVALYESDPEPRVKAYLRKAKELLAQRKWES